MDTSYDENIISLTETPSFTRKESSDITFMKKKFEAEAQEREVRVRNKYLQKMSSVIDEVKKRISKRKRTIEDADIYRQKLSELFNFVSPLIYLSHDQRKAFLKHAEFIKFEKKDTIYSGMEKLKETGDWSAFILMEGEMHIFDNKENFEDLISKVHFFGYDGPIFRRRFNTVLVQKKSIVAVIPEKVFIKHLLPFSKFCTFIARNIIHKDKVLDDLYKLKYHILTTHEEGIDMNKIINLYKRTNPCLHTKCSTKELDFSAWTYALHRLPESVLETYIYLLINKPPKILSAREEMLESLMPKIPSLARSRDVYRYLEGKNVIVVREMETDVLDFISNMCIHIIESAKLRKLISSPITIGKLYDAKGSFDGTLEVLQNTTDIKIDDFSKETLKKIFGNKFAEKLICLCLHHQDYSVNLMKLGTMDQDPVEMWTQNLWVVCRDLLNINKSVDEVDDLVVDIMQGSKRTLLGCISPHMYKNKEEIFKWGVDNNIQLKTKEFLTESDKLLAYSYYYYKEFPEKAMEKVLMEQEHGIQLISETFATGVQILLINVNKLDPKYVDPSIKLKSASKNHLILHIGYTFGAQSSHIIKPLLMLFGSKARSMNIIGKAGGLTGNRTDILVANKMFYDKAHELANINYGNVDVKGLQETTGSGVHFGPMLTVAGTILQNNDLLNFYKHVMGCVGLEMEGYFFVREIENAVKHELLDADFVTRCFYYSSDLPLDPTQNLSQEAGNVSWDEGIGSMNAIQRYILQQIISE